MDLGDVLSTMLQNSYVLFMLAMAVAGVWSMRGGKVKALAAHLDAEVTIAKRQKKELQGRDEAGRPWSLTLTADGNTGLAAGVQVDLARPAMKVVLKKEGVFKRKDDVKVGWMRSTPRWWWRDARWSCTRCCTRATGGRSAMRWPRAG